MLSTRIAAFFLRACIAAALTSFVGCSKKHIQSLSMGGSDSIDIYCAQGIEHWHLYFSIRRNGVVVVEQTWFDEGGDIVPHGKLPGDGAFRVIAATNAGIVAVVPTMIPERVVLLYASKTGRVWFHGSPNSPRSPVEHDEAMQMVHALWVESGSSNVWPVGMYRPEVGASALHNTLYKHSGAAALEN